MDKLMIRKDVFEDIIEKGYGKRDYSKLTKKVITDKNGHKRTVFVKNDVTQTTQKQPKTQELSEEKRAKYEEMLEKVKAGPNENALIVRGKTLNKEDAMAHLSKKLGIKESTQSDKNSNSEETEKKSFQKETFKSKTEKYKKMGLR